MMAKCIATTTGTSLCVMMAVLAVSCAHKRVGYLGETLVLSCDLSRGVKSSTWRYLTPNSKNERNKKYEEMKNKSYTSLKIRDVQFHDAGNYACLQYFLNQRSDETLFTLQVQGSPKLSLPRNESIENDSIAATCCVNISLTGDQIPIHWFIDSEPITPFNETKTIDGTVEYRTVCSRIHFQSSRFFHDVPLVCFLLSEHKISTERKLKVLYPPTVRMLMTSKIIPFNEGDEVKVICEANGNPQPIVRLQRKIDTLWYFPSMKPILVSMSGCNTTWLFRVSCTSRDMTGTYRCAAGNRIGEGYSTDTVDLVEIRSNPPAAVYILLSIALTTFVVIVITKSDRCIKFRSFVRKSYFEVVCFFGCSGPAENENDKAEMEASDTGNLQTSFIQDTENVNYVNQAYERSINTAGEIEHATETYQQLSTSDSRGGRRICQSHTYESIKSQKKFSISLEAISEFSDSQTTPQYHTLERDTGIKSTYYEEGTDT